MIINCPSLKTFLQKTIIGIVVIIIGPIHNLYKQNYSLSSPIHFCKEQMPEKERKQQSSTTPPHQQQSIDQLQSQAIQKVQPQTSNINFEKFNNIQRPLESFRQRKENVEKIVINCVAWEKRVSNLFDYEQDKKISKSGFFLEKEQIIRLLNSYNNLSAILTLQNPENTLLLLYRSKNRQVFHLVKKLQEINEEEINSQENQFLCALVLLHQNQLGTIKVKVYSLLELIQLANHLRTSQLQQNLTPNQDRLQKSRDIDQSGQSPYFIVRSLNSKKHLHQGYKLSAGDQIKLGKTLLKVISLDGSTQQDSSSEQDKRAVEVTQIDPQLEDKIQCKYCLGGKSDQHNSFFLHLCDCKGHIGYVHYDCLIQWTRTKAEVENSYHVRQYFLQKMKCEVCLRDFPKYFRYREKVYNILPLELPEKHLVLVDVAQKPNAMTAVIDIQDNQEVTVGRGRQSMLRINDITVSRSHAIISKVKGDYYIKDCKSKFGTLVRPNQDVLEVELDKKKGFQVANTIFTVQIVYKDDQKPPQRLQPISLSEQIELMNQKEIQKEENTHRQIKHQMKLEEVQANSILKIIHIVEEQSAEKELCKVPCKENVYQNCQQLQQNRSEQLSLVRKTFLKQKRKNFNHRGRQHDSGQKNQIIQQKESQGQRQNYSIKQNKSVERIEEQENQANKQEKQLKYRQCTQELPKEMKQQVGVPEKDQSEKEIMEESTNNFSQKINRKRNI